MILSKYTWAESCDIIPDSFFEGHFISTIKFYVYIFDLYELLTTLIDHTPSWMNLFSVIPKDNFQFFLTPLLWIIFSIDDSYKAEWLEFVSESFKEFAHELDPNEKHKKIG